MFHINGMLGCRFPSVIKRAVIMCIILIDLSRKFDKFWEHKHLHIVAAYNEGFKSPIYVVCSQVSVKR